MATWMRTIPKSKCPICNRTVEGWYCPFCGLPISTKERRRPENNNYEEFQLCAKCETPNPFCVKFCRGCGEKITLQAKDKNRHEWVDLGLSVLWSAETMDGFYAWMDSSTMLTKYSERLDYYYKGDGKDVASVKWGEKWRVPTIEEFEELINKCKWEKVVLTQSNEHAIKVTGPNGNHILLKTTGCGGCRKVRDEYNLGFNECEYSDCSFWTSSELVKENHLHSGAVFSYKGYSSKNFKPTLTFKQEFKNGRNPYYLEMALLLLDKQRGILANDERLNFINEKIKEWNEKMSKPDLEERKKNEDIDMQRRHALWLETPCEILPSNIHIGRKSVAHSIRPVAEKKWQGKL